MQSCHARAKMMVLLLMKEILHQMIGSLSHYSKGSLYPGGAGFLPSTVWYPQLILAKNGFFRWLWKKNNSIKLSIGLNSKLVRDMFNTVSLSYCWWKKSCTSWYGKDPIIYRVLYIPGGDRRISEPSTVQLSYHSSRSLKRNTRASKDWSASADFGSQPTRIPRVKPTGGDGWNQATKTTSLLQCAEKNPLQSTNSTGGIHIHLLVGCRIMHLIIWYELKMGLY